MGLTGYCPKCKSKLYPIDEGPMKTHKVCSYCETFQPDDNKTILEKVVAGSVNLFVQGGIYPAQKLGEKEYFKLVKPSGDELPYLWVSRTYAFHHCRHHSHTYRITKDLGLKLDTISLDAESSRISAPETVSTQDIREQLKAMLINGEVLRGPF